MPDHQQPTTAPARRQQPDSCAIVIFGATGDLTKRLVMPALYNLALTGMLPEKFALIGVARAEGSDDSWRDGLYSMLKSFVGDPTGGFNIDHIDEAAWKRLTRTMIYVRGDSTEPAVYSKIKDALGKAGIDNAIFYLAVADQLFGAIVAQLGKAGLTDEADGHWRRVVIEKPFGHSLESARALNAGILETLREDQIFRIDHFLGKETVQNIMAFRFANGLFEPIWNRDRIDHVQITVSETVGVEKRGAFYEATGAMRDMVPNHIFSLLALVAMEPPVSFDAAGILAKKSDVFAAMPSLTPGRAVRGQYGAGKVKDKPAVAYRAEPNVAPDSMIETYVAMRFEIDNWRWAGVPFYVRTGKHMTRRLTEIAICFKPAPQAAFENTCVDACRPNWLVMETAPVEGISLQFDVKRRGAEVDLAAVSMDFRYDDWFPKEPNVGYETLIHDVMIGDQTRFMRADMVEQAWRIVQPVLDDWAANKSELAEYASGSDGPKASDSMLAREGRAWRPLVATPK
jgi:glucose-6-phosphate 1-dehydrogenase